jgi:hypothetical protein
MDVKEYKRLLRHQARICLPPYTDTFLFLSRQDPWANLR